MHRPVTLGSRPIQQTGYELRDTLIALGLLRPGIDCGTTVFEEEQEVPPLRFPVAGYVFRQFPTPQEREAEQVRHELWKSGYILSETTPVAKEDLIKVKRYFTELCNERGIEPFRPGAQA